jgi:PAS domain S-box-containing protein
MELDKLSYRELELRVAELEAASRSDAKDPASELDFFESLDRVNRAMHGTNELQQMMQNVLDVVLSVFGCDRAFLLFACDPQADSWTVPMERTHANYPGAFALGVPEPMTPSVSALFELLLGSEGTVEFVAGNCFDPEEDPWKKFEIRSVLAMALRPRTGKAWQFGVHQCSYARVWTTHQKKLFLEIGRRLSDGLNTLLMYRNLQESEGLLDRIFENIPNVIFVKDAASLKFVRCNKAGETLLGYSRDELLQKTSYDLFSTEDADRYTATDRRVLDTKQLVDIPEETVRNRYDEQRILHTTKVPILDEAGRPKYVCGIAEDITKQRSLEAQLRQAQKMESIGRLAGGLAHDFNNMLAVIIGNADRALAHVGEGLPLHVRLQEIRRAAQRSADLTHQLLAFARKQAVVPKLLDLNQTLAGVINMLRPLIGEHIRVTWRPGTELWSVRIDPSQIDQVLTNLSVNARDAIAASGEIVIETRNVHFDADYCREHPTVLPGDYVLLSVRDDGCGMDKDTLSQIFEPFFTTKGVGMGTGLGLSIVYGIITQNSGYICVESERGSGTTFSLYLPRQDGVQSEVDAEQPIVRAPAGNETILLVEDEPGILDVVTLILEGLGYRVVAASKPSDAIRLARAHDGEIHLLITDVIMPEMNGLNLARGIAELFPRVRALFISGYMDDILAHHGFVREGIDFIQKPFSMQDFGSKVREILDAGGAAKVPL